MFVYTLIEQYTDGDKILNPFYAYLSSFTPFQD
jgi:hypothetical protein